MSILEVVSWKILDSPSGNVESWVPFLFFFLLPYNQTVVHFSSVSNLPSLSTLVKSDDFHCRRTKSAKNRRHTGGVGRSGSRVIGRIAGIVKKSSFK